MNSIKIQDYFEMDSSPFPKMAAPQALLRTPAMEHALSRMHFALERDTFTLLVADSGCGKSTLLGLFAQSLDAANYNLLDTSLTTLTPFSFIAHLATIMGVPPRRFKGQTAAAFLMHTRSLAKRTVILVDEAHQLPDSSLEDLRLMTTDHFDRQSPFSLVLVGKPLLRDRLAEPQHDAFWQRIGVKLRLPPLTQAETKDFLDRHLQAVGCRRMPLFEPAAVSHLFQHSRGVPRLIQNLAFESLLCAMRQEKKTVDQEAVQHAVLELGAI